MYDEEQLMWEREAAAENPFETPLQTTTPAQMADLNNMSIPMKIMADMQQKQQAEKLAQYMQPEEEPQEMKINPITEQPEIPLRPEARAVIMDEDETPDTYEQQGQRIIPKGSVMFRLVVKPEYTLNSIKNEDGVEGQYFYITTRYAESEALNIWKDYILQKYIVQDDIAVQNSYYQTDVVINYSEVQPTEKSAKVFIPEGEFSKMELVEMYTFPLALLRDFYTIEYRRFVNLPKGLMLYSADDGVIEQPQIAEDGVGVYFYTTRVLVEDYALQQWRDMVLNTYYLNRNLTVPYGKNNPRDPVFSEKYEIAIQDADTGEEQLLTSYFDDSVVGKYLHNEEATGELFITAEDIDVINYYGSFPMKLDDLKFIHGIQQPSIS